MEAYIDDMEVKSRQVGEHLADLGETFSVLREHKLRLNASRCPFWGQLGQIFGLHDYSLRNRSQPRQIKAY